MKPAGKYNKIQIGLVLGFIAPLIGFLVIYLAGFPGMSLSEFVELLIYNGRLSSIVSLSAIPNLLLFFIFIWLNYLYSARGVLATTLIFAGVVIITKFLI